jgi:hypothetical protein
MRRTEKKNYWRHCFARWVLSALVVSTSAATAQQRILETTQPPSTPPAGNWARDTCGGRTFLNPGGADYEWTPVIQGFGQQGSLEGISGWALAPHGSTQDVPFTHPFGKFDFDYQLLPDAQFQTLLAPGNTELDDDRTAAVADAKANNLQLNIAADGKHLDRGTIAVEQEVGLVPTNYRAWTAQRVAVFGRWIIDCGHANWQSEIHPPVLTVLASPNAGANRTRIDLIANPYLVDQEFAHGGLRKNLVYDLALINVPFPLIVFTDQVTAEAGILPPTTGMRLFSFLVRTPSSPANSQLSLYVRMHVTARSGVVFQPFLVDNETIGVVGIFTDQLTMHPVAGIKRWNVSGDELKNLDADAGLAWEAMAANIGLHTVDPVKAAVLQRGIRAVLYDPPQAPELNDPTVAPVIEGFAQMNPFGQNPVSVVDQPFPLIGWMELEWRKPPAAIASTVVAGTWKAAQREMEAMRLHGSAPTAEVMAANLEHASTLLATVAPKSHVDVTGKWELLVRSTPPERGNAALRSNGSYLQGILELAGGHRDKLSGTISLDGKQLNLVRTPTEGRETRMVLTLRGANYIGTIAESRTEVVLARVGAH